MEIIKIENLSFKYPAEYKEAIENISLSFAQGEFVTVCGKSGCGKSTLLRQLKPVLSPRGEKRGAIYFEGKNIENLTQKEQAEKIGFVFQCPDNQIVTDKVWHELAFGLENLSYSQEEIRTRVAEMASFFGIGGWFHKKVSELSGGQKQLLNLASVMVMQPKVLILDEPTSQLDPIAAQNFLETVYKINRELGVTVILSEHRLEEAFLLSDRAVVIAEGKIVADGTAREVGKILDETDDDMFYALPTPMRVYYSKKNEQNCPLTVRDARQWLTGISIDKDVKFDNIKPKKNDAVISFSDVWFRYEKDLQDVLKGLSLSVSEGEIYAIVGGNGSGKTTVLSLIAGFCRHYRGEIKIKDGKKVALLAQNPQSLFVEKTVELDLYEMLDGTSLSEEEKEKRVNSVVDFCELSSVTSRHPYDLSGGEQQRAALAKILLTEPDILLLDEVTKGLDAHFKEKLANMLKELKNSGVTIIMVSHDIEFCARYADRCGMLFDGIITGEDTSRNFFSGKNFYTTTANKIARNIIDGAVLDEDIIEAIGGKHRKKSQKTASHFPKNQGKTHKKEKNTLRPIIKEKAKLSKSTVMTMVTILLLIPVTIFLGITYLGGRKYYFLSLMVLLEAMLPFAFVFEKRKPQAREIVLISVLCAIAVCGRIAFYMLPQFKPVLAIVIISGVCFGGETGFLVGAITAFVSNFFFGQTPLTPWQMFAFGIIGFLSGELVQKGILKLTKTKLCIFGFLSALILYGGIMNPAAVILSQTRPTKEMFLSSFAAGFSFDIIHSASTAFFLYFIAEPMIEKLDRIKVKYGLLK